MQVHFAPGRDGAGDVLENDDDDDLYSNYYSDVVLRERYCPELPADKERGT